MKTTIAAMALLCAVPIWHLWRRHLTDWLEDQQ